MTDPSEDGIATELIQYINKNNIPVKNTIIDIGANDGFDISNSFVFIHDLDWVGVLVEPQPQLKEKLKTLHEGKDIFVVTAAISNFTGKAKLVNHPNDDRKSRNSEINNMGAALVDRGGKESWEVDVITFNELNNRLEGCLPHNVGIVSIDTEGNDKTVIESILETNIRPTFIITEVWQGIEEEKHKLLTENDYKLIIDKPTNKVYEYAG